jgi:serine/threonine protein kinase/CHASE2 domain-containing sensor protein
VADDDRPVDEPDLRDDEAETQHGASAARSPSREPTVPLAPGEQSKHAQFKPTLPDYECIEVIGSGGFGEVWLARNRHSGKFVAVKLLRRGRALELEGIRKYLLSVADHPHLVPVEHVGQTGKQVGDLVYVVMPLADNAREGSPVADPHDYRPYTLEAHLSRSGKIDSGECAAIGANVASALAYMHQRGAAHSDVKPPNILRFGGDWRLGDCSLVVFLEDRNSAGFTPGYAPPDGVTGPPADLYGLGITLLEMLTGATPHPGHVPGADLPANDPLRRDPVWKIAQQLVAREGSGRITSADDAAERLDALKPKTVADHAESPRRHGAMFVALWVVVASLLATGASLGISRPLFFSWTTLNNQYWAWLGADEPAKIAKVLRSLDDVAIIAMSDETPLAEIIDRENLAGVDPKNLRSLRRMHARLCEALVAAEPRVVVWDIVFRTPSPYDAELAAGIEALTDDGVGVVLTSFGWPDSASLAPPVAPALWATHSKWGSNHYMRDTTGTVWFPLIIERDTGENLPGIVLSAFAAARNPDAWFDVAMDQREQQVIINYWVPTPERPGGRRTIGAPDRVTLTLVQERGAEPRRGVDPGLQAGDLMGLYLARVAPKSALDAVTYDYADILNATPAERQELLRKRVVVIGDFREAAGDVLDVAGHGMVPGPHVLASSIETMLARGGARTQTRTESAVTMGLAALATGTITAIALLRRNLRSWIRWIVATAGLCAVSALLVGGALFAFRAYGYMYTPLPAMLAALLTFVLVLVLPARATD